MEKTDSEGWPDDKPKAIKVYGDDAELINDGDIFRAKVTYVEGRKVVKLLFGGMEDDEQ